MELHKPDMTLEHQLFRWHRSANVRDDWGDWVHAWHAFGIREEIRLHLALGETLTDEQRETLARDDAAFDEVADEVIPAAMMKPLTFARQPPDAYVHDCIRRWEERRARTLRTPSPSAPEAR